jgi:hypothetical protein
LEQFTKRNGQTDTGWDNNFKKLIYKEYLIMKKTTFFFTFLLFAAVAIYGQEEQPVVVAVPDMQMESFEQEEAFEPIDEMQEVPNYAFQDSEDELPVLTQFQRTAVSKIVEKWVEEMFKAESIDHLMALSDVPFAMDREKVLTTTDEMWAMYQNIFQNKGKRPLPRYEIVEMKYKSEIIDYVIPVNTVTVVVLFYDEKGEAGKGIGLCVSIRDNICRVVGFSD